MPTGDTANIHPALWAAAVATERDMGETLVIVSGYRSPAEQVALWNDRANNPYPVAKPKSLGGTGSKHERSPAEAIDVARSQVSKVRAAGRKHGLIAPHATDPIHFELSGLRGFDVGGGLNVPGLEVPTLDLPNPLAPLGAVVGVVNAILNPRAWAIRLLEVVGGVALIVLGARILAVDLGAPVAALAGRG